MKPPATVLSLEPEAHGGLAYFKALSQSANHFVVLSIDCAPFERRDQEKFRHQKLGGERIRLNFCRIRACGGKRVTSQRPFINVNRGFDLRTVELNVGQLVGEGKSLPVRMVQRVHANDWNSIF